MGFQVETTLEAPKRVASIICLNLLHVDRMWRQNMEPRRCEQKGNCGKILALAVDVLLFHLRWLHLFIVRRGFVIFEKPQQSPHEFALHISCLDLHYTLRVRAGVHDVFDLRQRGPQCPCFSHSATIHRANSPCGDELEDLLLG